MLKKICETGKPLIMSTGMHSLEEVEESVEKLIKKCEERNFNSDNIITWKQSGYGGWKSIGDIFL